MRKVLMTALLSSALFGANAYAEEGSGNFYVGLGIGQIDVDLGSGVDVDGDTPLKFYAGYKFSPKLAVEVHHVSIDLDVTGASVGTVEYKNKGIALVSSLPLSPNFSLLGKLGYGKNEGLATVSAGGVSVSSSASDNDLFFGLGAQYNINSNFAIRGEFDNLDSDANLFTVGANYTF